jgi:hypothetical protein
MLRPPQEFVIVGIHHHFNSKGIKYPHFLKHISEIGAYRCVCSIQLFIVPHNIMGKIF